MIAALFVAKDGPYINVNGVDPWTVERDARAYSGPHPVIAHPPCERWGRYWSGGPSARTRRALGDDGGCFRAALESVRRFGGVLEHPAHTHAWKKFGLLAPPMDGGVGFGRRLARIRLSRRAGPLRAPREKGHMALRGFEGASNFEVGRKRRDPNGRGISLERGASPRSS